MTPEELLFALFQTMTEHLKLPEGFGWVPLAGLGLVTALGLVLLLRGAKWARGLAALGFLALGGCGGSLLAHAVGTPFWLTVWVVGVVGCVLGMLLFRFWQALLLGACCIVAGLSVYYVRTLTPEVQNWVSASTEPSLLTLQPAGTVVGNEQPGALAELGSLWTHLAQNVPNFATTFWALVLSTGLAGLIFGLLLPRASRALWAASLGTALFGIGATALLSRFMPSVLDWLLANHAWAWGIVGLVWLLSLAYNLVTGRRGKPAQASEEAAAKAKGEPAPA